MSSMEKLLQAVAGRITAKGYEDCALVVMDLGGQPLLSWRALDVGFFYADLAKGKAWTAVALKRTPSLTGASLNTRPATAAFLAGLGHGQFVPIEGGALLVDGDTIVCGIGVAGPASGKADMAEIEALAAATGLVVHNGEAHGSGRP